MAGNRSGRVHSSGWMDDIKWLRFREKAIRERIDNERSPVPTVALDPSSRRARREALQVIEHRISELEAMVDHDQGGESSGRTVVSAQSGEDAASS